MRAALEQAGSARCRRGAHRRRLVVNERIVADAFNQPIGSVDPTAHAEVLVLREAAHALGNYRLTDAIVYVTVEPCLMCVGALVHARVREVVYGDDRAEDRRAGLGGARARAARAQSSLRSHRRRARARVPRDHSEVLLGQAAIRAHRRRRLGQPRDQVQLALVRWVRFLVRAAFFAAARRALRGRRRATAFA